MIATKEQERNALGKIKKIVEGLGNDSYVGTAFDGCIDIATQNIENDFMCSMKQRADEAEANFQKMKKAAEYYAAEQEKAEKERDDLKGQVFTRNELVSIKLLINNEIQRQEDVVASAVDVIVEEADQNRTISEAFRQAVVDRRNSLALQKELQGLLAKVKEAIMQHN